MPPPEGPPPSELATSSAVDSEDFVASSSFSGPRQGFIFKTDEKGTGYYKDVGLAGWLARKQGQARAKPVIIKANKSIAKLPLRGGSEPAAKKAKTDKSKPAYLREMERHRAVSCDSGKSNRPLVK